MDDHCIFVMPDSMSKADAEKAEAKLKEKLATELEKGVKAK